MTERSNDASGDELAPSADSVDPELPAEKPVEAPVEATETAREVAEEAPGLTNAQLDDAAGAAEDKVQAAGADAAAEMGAANLAAETADDVEDEDDAGGAVPALPVGARARADEEARLRREAKRRREHPEERRGRFGRRTRVVEEDDDHVRAPTRTPFAIDPALRIKDPVSSAFVAAAILVFVLVFAGAMAFGKGGAFTHRPTAAPIVTISPGPAVSPGASGSTSPSGSPAVSPVASPAASPAPTASSASAS